MIIPEVSAFFVFAFFTFLQSMKKCFPIFTSVIIKVILRVLIIAIFARYMLTDTPLSDKGAEFKLRQNNTLNRTGFYKIV